MRTCLGPVVRRAIHAELIRFTDVPSIEGLRRALTAAGRQIAGLARWIEPIIVTAS